MTKRFFLLLLTIFALASCNNEHGNLPDGLYADIETNKGTITVSLEFEKTPFTVASFVSLAEGKNTFATEGYKGKPFYDGLTFHRVVKEPQPFVIQGGCPLGNGTGDAGYRFRDEIVPEFKFDKAGILAMANSGPGTSTNGSQFFITLAPTPNLNGSHTIFGHVVGNGMDVVNQIEQDDDIVSITIIRKGESAKKFDAPKVFADFLSKEEENQKKQAAIDAENKRAYDAKYKAVKDKKVAELQALFKTSKKTNSGLQYVILKKGNGKKPQNGAMLNLKYSGWLEDGHLVDSNIEAIAKEFGKHDERASAYGKYEPIQFPYGRKDGMIPGFIEGIEMLHYGDKGLFFIPANLAFGPQGASPEVPPNANMIFEIELVP